LELYIDHRGVQTLEAARALAEMALQKRLIGSHALFSPSKRASPLKFETSADQILKRADRELDTEDDMACFVVLSQ
jgi:hypothetical protein